MRSREDDTTDTRETPDENEDVEIEVEWPEQVRLHPGQYEARCVSATKPHWNYRYRRWQCVLGWELEHGVRVPWWLPMGKDRKRPRVARGMKYWEAWAGAKGAPPERSDRFSPRVFPGRTAVIEIRNSKPGYSVVERVISWHPQEGTVLTTSAGKTLPAQGLTIVKGEGRRVKGERRTKTQDPRIENRDQEPRTAKHEAGSQSADLVSPSPNFTVDELDPRRTPGRTFRPPRWDDIGKR